MSYGNNHNRIPSHHSPHHPNYSNGYIQGQPSQNMGQYRERNIPQISNNRGQMPINPPVYQQPQNRAGYNYEDIPSIPGTDGQYLLYYSNYCINSKEFMNILCKTKYYNMFTKINISKTQMPRPKFLKFTPTIIVPGVDRPLFGEDVFSWLEQADQKNNNTQGSDNEGGIKPFQPMEMSSSMSDSYSYLDVDPSAQPIEHSFSFLGKPLEPINTPQESEYDRGDKSSRADMNMANRPPLPQGMQNQVNVPPGMAMPSIPQNSADAESDSVDKAFQDLMDRRNSEFPQQRRQDI